MKFCGSCGAALGGPTMFCAQCGAAVAPATPVAASAAGATGVASAAGTGLPPLRPASYTRNGAWAAGMVALTVLTGATTFLLLR